MIAFRMPTMKEHFIRFFGFGVGTGLALALAFLAIAWWDSRPAKPKPWDTKAVTASYINFRVNDDHDFDFSYSFRNNTDQDITLVDDSALLRIVGKTSEGDLAECDKCITLKSSSFIPAHKSTQVSLLLHDKSPSGSDAGSSPEATQAHKQALQYLRDDYKRLDGFEIFDETRRIEIVMAPGWKK